MIGMVHKRLIATHYYGQLPSLSENKGRFACPRQATQELTTSSDFNSRSKEDAGLTPRGASPAPSSDADVSGIGFPY